jgi:sedoheptulose-bisphosphatase
VADAVAEISDVLRDTDVSAAGSTNSFGDDQLQADIVADDLIFKHLRSCPHVETASSEEQSDILPMGGQGYTVRRHSSFGVRGDTIAALCLTV